VKALAGAAARGARVAALHPLMSFSAVPASVGAADGADGADVPGVASVPGAGAALARLAGCAWALEAGDEALAGDLEGIVRLLGGYAIRIGAADRVPYHIAAVLASNYVVALLGAAIALWEGFGVPADAARDALMPLVRASVENVARVGPARALTGPVARGDAGTIAAHLRWLAARTTDGAGVHPAPLAAARERDDSGQADDPGARDPATLDPATLLTAYRDLARLAIPLARARGSLSAEAASALRAVLAGEGPGGEERGGG
jgi:predicted short-subunit dehydrogenase-like oxidoreductase (DUF2520 family)